MPAAFDLDLAAAVLSRTTTATLNLLESLLSRSLLQSTRDDRSPQLRYRLLETIRAFAHDRFVERGDAEATRERHARHIVERLSAAIFIARGLFDKGIALHEWAATVDDPVMRSKVYAVGAILAMAAGTRGMARFAQRSLQAAGDLPVPWRALPHGVLLVQTLFADTDSHAENRR